MRIKWLHISDMHFHLGNANTTILRNDLIRRIRAHSDVERFSHLFFTGDILDKNGTVSPQIKTYFDEIIVAAKVEQSECYLVPGNHDRNRTSVLDILNKIYDCAPENNPEDIISALTEVDYKCLFESFSNFYEVHKQLTNRDYYSNWSNPHIIETADSIQLIKLNTSWLERDSSESGYLRCSSDMLSEVVNAAKTDNRIVFAIGHHPLASFQENEAKRIKALFKDGDVSIYLCGHVHNPKVCYDAHYDVLEVCCNAALSDNYTPGGYVIGTFDDVTNCYKTEFFRWHENGWFTEIGIDGTNENGVYYFNTKRFKHSIENVVFSFKGLGPQINASDISSALGHENYELVCYPYTNIDIDEIDWSLHKKTTSEFAHQLLNLRNKDIFVFSLAPIPLLVHFGHEIQKNFRINLFQYDRDNGNWVNAESSPNPTNKLSVTKKEANNSGLVVIVASSTPIYENQISSIVNLNDFDTISFSTEIQKLGYPLFRTQISHLINEISTILSQVATRYSEIHLFASVPASVAIELGRMIQKGVFPPVHLYNYRQGYQYAFSINEKAR